MNNFDFLDGSDNNFISQSASLLALCGFLTKKGIISHEDMELICGNTMKILNHYTDFQISTDKILGATLNKMDLPEPFSILNKSPIYNNFNVKKEIESLKKSAEKIDSLSNYQGKLSERLIQNTFKIISETKKTLENKYLRDK